jgi:CDP-diacylglycerol--serine O-phosphatidyltransferase
MKQIPNLFTLLNLIFGCMAIVAVLQNGITIQVDAEGSQFIDIPEKIWMASLFIGLAGVVDFLDGFVARLFKATSEMGAQLDSLADVVSFGVAPSMIMYQFLRMSYASETNGVETSVLLLIPAFFIAAAAAYRLAKFNLDKSQSTVFKGVPTPAIGILVASFPLIYWHAEYDFVLQLLLNKWFLYSLIVTLCLLMVGNMSIMSLKIKNLNVKDNLHLYLMVVSGVVFSISLGWIAVPLLFVTYIILSLVFKKKLSSQL